MRVSKRRCYQLKLITHLRALAAGNDRHKPIFKAKRLEYFLPLPLVLSLGLGIECAKGLTTNSVGMVQYQAFDGKDYMLKPWLGRNIAVLTPPKQVLDTNVMTRIIDALDMAWDFYGQATGRQPAPFDPTSIFGRDVIAVVTNTCGAGCSYIGFTGTEILNQYFNILYNGVASAGQYDQVLFYEFGRNFWFYSDQLAYHSPDVDPVVTGFAVYMRFVAMDAAGVAGGPFNGYPFATFRTAVTNLMDTYISNRALSWNNTFRLSQAPSNALGLGGSDLIASLLMRIGRDFGGPDFTKNFWKQVVRQPAASTTQAAVDNFVLAACATVNQNLTRIFSTTWKFPVSTSAVQAAQLRWGNPTVLHPALTFSADAKSGLTLRWQGQVNTIYQLEQSSDLSTWVNSGGLIPGLGLVRTVTNSISPSTNAYFRLMVQ
jgi:hypothetical protein